MQNRADVAAALLMQKKRKTEDKQNEPTQKASKVEDESFHGFSIVLQIEFFELIDHGRAKE